MKPMKKDREVKNWLISPFFSLGTERHRYQNKTLLFNKRTLKWKLKVGMIQKKSLWSPKRQRDGELTKMHFITSFLYSRPLALTLKRSLSSKREGHIRDLIKIFLSFSYESLNLRYLTTINSPKERWTTMPRGQRANSIPLREVSSRVRNSPSKIFPFIYIRNH